MAFPGTYNIDYYKGDTLEFLIYPKTTSGGAFSLVNFNNANFTISNFRGETSSSGEAKVTIQAYAEVVSNQYIKCVIRPIDGNGDDTVESPGMVGGKSYVYDVEIAYSTTPYDQVYTLLTGNVSVQEQVTTPDITGDTGVVELVAPDAPTTIVVGTPTDTTIPMSWTAPAGGSRVDGYNIYIIENPTGIPNIADATLVDTIASNLTSYTYTGLTPLTAHIIGLRAFNVTDALVVQESDPLINLSAVITEAGS
jgi:hypothetical protein